MKNNNIKFIFTLFIVTLFFQSYAQDTLSESKPEYKQSKHALGLLGSLDSGLGISYRYRYDKIGLQVSTLPFYVTLGSGFYLQYIGLAAQYHYLTRDRFMLYGYLGNNLSIAISSTSGVYLLDNISGLGTGVDFKIGTNLSFQFQLGYAIVGRSESTMFDGVKGFVSPGIGILYNF